MVSCPSCNQPNDFDFNFCLKCGHRREPIDCRTDPPPLVNVDSVRVKNRLASLKAYKKAKPYQRQKSSLQRQLESYLWSLPDKKSLNIASPQDIIGFLIWRDKFGKTILHADDCSASSGGKDPCICSRALAAGTIENNIAKLKSIFRDNGRGSQWNNELNLGNPAAHSSIKKYHKLILEEQVQAKIFPSQAVPLFLDKLKSLCSHLRSLATAPNVNLSRRFILARDLAFFSIDFFSGDRGSDLGRVKSSDVLSLPDNKGLLINQVFGKTLRRNRSNVFGLKPIPNSSFCPVTNLRFYVALSEKMGVVLKGGFLFRATNPRGNITESPFVASAVANRLRKLLTDLKICNGETMHSF